MEGAQEREVGNEQDRQRRIECGGTAAQLGFIGQQGDADKGEIDGGAE